MAGDQACELALGLTRQERGGRAAEGEGLDARVLGDFACLGVPRESVSY